MDEMNETAPDKTAPDETAPNETVTSEAAMNESPHDQPSLPLDLEAVTPLPYDDESEQPVSLMLTARGRRAVGAADLPDLQIVPDAPETPRAYPVAASTSADHRDLPVDEDPRDTRPSQARALRRAGRDAAAIAERLEVDELLVRAWISDVTPSRGHRRTVRGQQRAASSAGRSTPRERQQAADRVQDHRTGFELARAAAREDALHARLADPGFAAGIGLLAGIAEFDPHAVTLTTGSAELATTALRWIRDQVDVEEGRIRIVLRIGPRVAGDLAAHRWARDLEVGRQQVAVASWRAAPADDAEQVLLRVADPSVAATLAGWRDALLSPTGSDPADVAF